MSFEQGQLDKLGTRVRIDSAAEILFLHQSEEKSFTLPVLARVTPATGSVPVQEQLV